MSLEDLVSKYIGKAERALAELKTCEVVVHVDNRKTCGIIEEARRYLNDAKYYRNRKQFETGLASVAYCEGLLDALRLLGVVKFTWSNLNGKG